MKNDPLLLEIQEEISRENMVKFVNKYGKLLAVAGILLFVGVAAYQFWLQYHLKESAKTGSVVYKIMSDKPQDEFALKSLDEASHAPGYFEIALMNKAQIQIKNNDFPGAIASFDAVAKSSHADKALKDLAALNAANLLLNTNPKADGLEKRLSDLTDQDNSFKYNAMELLASYYLQNGSDKKAQEVLEKLTKEANVPVSISKRARELMPHTATQAENEED